MSEQLQTRCPRLGGEVSFAYCLKEGGELPCPRSIICWRPYFPVEAYLKARLSPRQWEDWTLSKPKGKMVSLIELIEEAKRGMEDKA